MTCEQALKDGDLDVARAILDERAELLETGGLHMPECYADLARSYDHQGRHDDAITAHQRAIAHGWSTIQGRPCEQPYRWGFTMHKAGSSIGGQG
jgi:hypothetical protein